MPVIKVTPDQLESVSSSLRGGAEEVAQQLSSMEKLVSGLVSDGWQGAASEAFNDMWQKWHTGAGQVQEALSGISSLLAQSAKAYQDNESGIVSRMNAN